ncbi:MAG: Phosphoribosylamine--glycine ligase [Firmicutes bacterium ADurb.Bin182]|nr:MAG: Phosphoribosylamine--glycine ligase [Firmicutes bacterium ADurb.Bin182]
MRVMAVGGGGREHAIVKKLLESSRISHLYALPGNGGMAGEAECINIAPTDIDAMVSFAKARNVDFAVVAPDNPLVSGAVDRLQEAGVRCFGPSAGAAAIEGSKIYAKGLMQKYGIPTARHKAFDDADKALDYLSIHDYPAVIKADGLALGKGVFIAEDMGQAQKAVAALMQEKIFGASGQRIIIEEYLHGVEVSVLAFTDGNTIIPMVSAMDHKRAGEGDTGPNTGGMGAIAPNPYYTDEIAAVCTERIFKPTIDALRSESRRFKGCIYFGLMLTAQGPKVIEYNCRFGDPETQAVLPLLETDLFEIMLVVEEERLDEVQVKFSGDSVCCVVMASEGYPDKYSTGCPINLNNAAGMDGITIFHAGTKLENGRLFTSGGRVLGVTARAASAAEAVEKAYAAVDRIEFENAYYRRDIGRSLRRD